MVAKLNETYAASSLRDLMLRRAILGGWKVHLEMLQVVFIDATGKHVRKTIVQGQPKGARVQFGYLNPMQVWFKSSRVGDGNVGYVAFNVFLDAQRLMTSFGDAVQSSKNARACSLICAEIRGASGSWRWGWRAGSLHSRIRS